jgi:hypothetical protein
MTSMTLEKIERRGKVEPLTPRFVRFMTEALAGRALDDLQAPSDRRIDYSCLRGLLAVELKSLEDDGSERMSNLTDALKQQKDWPEFYGQWPLDSVLANLDDPESAKQKSSERVGRAIVKHLKKANKQLAAHAETFPRRNLVRLVVLLNEDQEIYDPATARYIIQKELNRIDSTAPRYESIDAVVYLSERHATRAGNDVGFPVIAVMGQPMDDASWKADLIDVVVQRWAAWSGARHIDGRPDAMRPFATIDHIPERMRRQDLWRLQYHRNSYMRSWTSEQVRDCWDECAVMNMLAMMKDSPARPSKEDVMRNLERFTHVLEEVAHRGITLPELRAETVRLMEAGKRLKLAPSVMTWLAANVAHLADRTEPGNKRQST